LVIFVIFLVASIITELEVSLLFEELASACCNPLCGELGHGVWHFNLVSQSLHHLVKC
jgi:hypothetical protein